MKYFIAVLGSLLLTGTAVASNMGDISPPASRATAANVSITGTETDGGPGDCSFVIIDVTADIEGTNDLGGGNDQVRFSIWDDGVEVAFEVISVPVGESQTVTVTLEFEGLVAVGVTGVAVIIYDGPTTGPSLFSVDPFVPDTVSGSCPGGPSTGSPLSVPVNSAWGLIALSGALVLFGFGVLRSRG